MLATPLPKYRPMPWRAIWRRRWLMGLGLLFLCGLQMAALHAQKDAPLTLAAYRAQLESWQAMLATADGAEQLTTIQEEAATIRQLTLPSGTVITIQPLFGEPSTERLDVATAQARLTTVLNELEVAAGDDTVARLQLLQNIFQGPEFVEHDSLWQRFWRWLRSWLPTIESQEGAAAPASPFFQWLGWALLGVGAALLIWLLSYWLQNLLGSFMGGVEKRSSTDDSALPQTAVEARIAAHRLAEAGSYRDAVRHLYLSALLSLHERNLLTYQASDTNREVLTAVRDQPQLYQELQPVIATFDDTWYGVHEPDRSTFDAYVTAVEKLEGKA